MKLFEQPTRYVNSTFLHCSASDAVTEAYFGHALLETIRSWHTERGWSDVGYHYLIDKEGVVMEGRPLNRNPAAQKGYNINSIAIMVHGLEHFSAASLEALQGLCVQINEAYSGLMRFRGHCEVSTKACPVFNYRSILRLDSFGRMPDAELFPLHVSPRIDL